MDIVEQAHVLLLTPRHYPFSPVIKLPGIVVGDLPALLAEAQQIDPSATYEMLVRALWRLGLGQLRRNLDRHVRLSRWDVTGEGTPR